MAKSYELHRQRLIGQFATGSKILDVGCARLPNRFLRAETVVGFDIEDMQVAPPYTEHVLGDIYEIDTLLGKRRFDTVVLGEVIEHVEQPYRLLRIIRRCMAKGGRLVLSTPNPIGLPVVAAEYCTCRRFFYTPNHLYYFTPRWVWRLLEKCGYRVLKTKGCGIPAWYCILPAPAVLSYTVIYVAMIHTK